MPRPPDTPFFHGTLFRRSLQKKFMSSAQMSISANLVVAQGMGSQTPNLDLPWRYRRMGVDAPALVPAAPCSGQRGSNLVI